MTALSLVPPPPPPDEEPRKPRKHTRWEDLLIAPAGRYRALKKIADGGTAEIFLGEHVGNAGFRRLVALKRMHAALAEQPMHHRMLLDEAHVVSGLHHGNLVEVRDLGEINGRHFLVLELVDGWSFAKLLERSRAAKLPIPPRVAVHVAAEVCRGLIHAHDRGIVHCDVCPHNILVAETGEVKLTDFGIALVNGRPRPPGLVAGKPAYMSPEQASGEAIDPRSDLFSLGTVLYSALTGVLPFRGRSDEEMMARVASGEFKAPTKQRPSLPKEMGQILLQAMRREPWARYQTAHDLLGAFETVLRANGRSELERWVAQLHEADRLTPPTRETTAPVVPLKVARTPMTKKAPVRRPRKMFWAALLCAVLGLTADRAWRWVGTASASEVPPAVEGLAAHAAASLRLPDLAPAPAPAPVVAPISVQEAEPLVSTTPPPMTVSGRVEGAYDQDRVMVLLDTEPEGADVVIDERVLGTTPVTLRFRTGIPFEVSFLREGDAPVVKWMIVERPEKGRARVSFSEPRPKS